jgi:hypothetical protein
MFYYTLFVNDKIFIPAAFLSIEHVNYIGKNILDTNGKQPPYKQQHFAPALFLSEMHAQNYIEELGRLSYCPPNIEIKKIEIKPG